MTDEERQAEFARLITQVTDADRAYIMALMLVMLTLEGDAAAELSAARRAGEAHSWLQAHGWLTLAGELGPAALEARAKRQARDAAESAEAGRLVDLALTPWLYAQGIN